MTGMDVARLREVAEKATPGPWARARTDLDGYAVYRGEHTTIALYCHPDNAEHIATFDPPTVLALLDTLADRDARLARAEPLLAEVDRWHVYESRDMGPAFSADSVRDLTGDIRAVLHPDPSES